jgi:glycosyltransferase involved in cell wall biosynthesis
MYKFLFSVIMPVYKTEANLSETIDTVIRQSEGF